jgi:hypothetical protein
VVSAACPAETAVKPSDTVPSKNSTQPAAVAGMTVADRVTGWPAEGLFGLTESAVWVASGCTSLAWVPLTYHV